MALADLMEKGFLTSATATAAAPATHRGAKHLTVATVAGVAVAKPPNAKSAFDPELLTQFRFDLVQAEIDGGQPANELNRVNNMAWEFMQVDGMVFEDAIRLAAEIVVNCQVAACEASYADLMAFFLKVIHAKD